MKERLIQLITILKTPGNYDEVNLSKGKVAELYRKQEAVVKLEHQTSNRIPIQKGVRPSRQYYKIHIQMGSSKELWSQWRM